uniref:Uncharacterized protein n=1 Tax=Entomoneis paludosa TaxID=265537 RepID=A0A7S2YAY0_9STRA
MRSFTLPKLGARFHGIQFPIQEMIHSLLMTLVVKPKQGANGDWQSSIGVIVSFLVCFVCISTMFSASAMNPLGTSAFQKYLAFYIRHECRNVFFSFLFHELLILKRNIIHQIIGPLGQSNDQSIQFRC